MFKLFRILFNTMCYIKRGTLKIQLVNQDGSIS